MPIDLGPETDQLYLILFGTGRGTTANASNVQVNIGNISAAATYAGAQGIWSGLDQYNVPIPRALAGKGKVNVSLTVNGKSSNSVSLTFK